MWQLLEAAKDTMSMAFECWSDGESACNICGYTITGGKQKLNQIYPHDPDCPIPALGEAVMQAYGWYKA
jgi:hypothetical protein